MITLYRIFLIILHVFTSHSQTVLNQTEQNEIVRLHNHYRSLVALGKTTDENGDNLPTAKYMYEMTWDDDLAKVAQAYADECIWAHNMERQEQFCNVKDVSFDFQCDSDYAIGENLGEHDVESIKFDAIKYWYEEHQHFKWEKLCTYECKEYFSKVGHFTTLASAITSKVGM